MNRRGVPRPLAMAGVTRTTPSPFQMPRFLRFSFSRLVALPLPLARLPQAPGLRIFLQHTEQNLYLDFQGESPALPVQSLATTDAASRQSHAVSAVALDRGRWLQA
jgi:hypothetical protein